MTEELELEQAIPDHSPKPTLVEPMPPADSIPVRPKARISRWLAIFAVLGLLTAGTVLWLQSRGFETTDDAQVDGHFDSISSRISIRTPRRFRAIRSSPLSSSTCSPLIRSCFGTVHPLVC